MVQSPQYPDLEIIYPRSYTRGRQAGRPVYITIHETDNPTSSARGEARYMQTRTDGVSCHYVVDELELIQVVPTTDTAHTALYHGNRDGIHYEFCGVSGRPDTFDAQLRLAAKQMARDMLRHNIPIWRLTVAQTREAKRGFNSHADITAAWPEDGGNHTDPGTGFPWDTLFTYIRAELEGTTMDETDATEARIWKLIDTGLRGVSETAQFPKPGGGTWSRPLNWLVRRLLELEEAITAQRLEPVPVVLSDEQLAALSENIADQVTARLGSLRFVAEES